MKRKLLAFIATLIIVFGTTLVPAGSFLLAPRILGGVGIFGAQTAHAQWNQSGIGTGGTSAPATPGSGTTTTIDPNQGNGTSTTTDPTNTAGSSQTITGNNSGSLQSPGGTSGSSSSTSQNQAVVPPVNNQSGQFTCSITDVLCGLVKFANFLLNSITNLVATVAGLILDFSIHYSISSGSYSNTVVNTILVSGWKLIRDFSTIFLMFALFVVGFMLIFNAEGSDGSWAAHFSPGRTIARVIIVALLVNFSFFLCRSVIEVGNVFAMVLYDKIDQGNQSVQTYPSAGSIDTSTALGKPSNVFKNTPFSNVKSISVGLLANINPQRVILAPSIVSSNIVHGSFLGFDIDYYTGSFYIAYLFVSFVSAIINLLMLFIFASMAFLFLGRIIGLYLAIILSPFAFVSWTIPFLENMPFIGFDNWFKELLGLTFLAPVYMLFVYLTVAFMQIPNPTAGSGVMAAAVFAVIDALLCVFVLLKGKKIAENMAGQLGTIISGFAGKIAMAGVGLATGGTAMLASGTIGAAGGVLARSGTLKRLQDAGPSQKQEDVQQRMKTASTFRKFGLNRVADSVARGDFSTGGLLSNTARGVRNIGKSAATTNPLDAKILGTSVRGSAASIAKMSGNRDLAAGLIKGQRADTAKAAIKDRALDIAATKNAQNTITNNQTAAVTQGLGNPLASAPSTGKPAGSSSTVTVTPGTGNGTAGGIKQTFKLGGNSTVANPGMQRQGFPGGSINPSPTQPNNIPPNTPPNNPPTGGSTPTNPSNPPKQSGVPVRLAGNTPLDEKTSGVAMPRMMFNQNLKPTAPPSISSKENIPSLTGDDEMDEALRRSATKPAVGAPTLTGDHDMDDALRATATSVPTTKSGSSATNFLSAIQGSAPAQETKTVIEKTIVQQPTETIIKQVSSAPTIPTTQPASKTVEQPTQTATRTGNTIQQANMITGSGSSAIKNIQAAQKNFEEKNLEKSLLDKNNPHAEINRQALDKIDAANAEKINNALLIKQNADRGEKTRQATEPLGENLDKILQMPDSQEKTNLLNQHNAQIENIWKESLDT